MSSEYTENISCRQPERTMFIIEHSNGEREILVQPEVVDNCIQYGGELIAEINGRDFEVEVHNHEN